MGEVYPSHVTHTWEAAGPSPPAAVSIAEPGCADISLAPACEPYSACNGSISRAWLVRPRLQDSSTWAPPLTSDMGLVTYLSGFLEAPLCICPQVVLWMSFRKWLFYMICYGICSNKSFFYHVATCKKIKQNVLEELPTQVRTCFTIFIPILLIRKSKRAR